jgi:hypothetical protein
VLSILDEIDPAGLSAPALEAYDRIVEALKPRLLASDGALGVSAALTAAPTVRVRTNTDLPFTREYAETPPFLSLPAALFFSDMIQLTLDPMATRDPVFYNTAGFWGEHNIPYEDKHFDMNMPLRSFIAAGSPWWNFQFGRDKLSFGAGHTGNMAVSATPDYYDFARLSLFSPNLKYSLLISQMPLVTESLLAPGTADPGDTALEGTTQRYLYLHRLDMRFFGKFSLGVGEGLMVGNSPPEPRFLSPLVIFHSFFAWRDYEKWGRGDMVGSLLSLDLEWALLPSLTFYGQGVMNEFALPSEQVHIDTLSPRGLGFLAGLEYAGVFGKWRALFYGEFVYTDPYLYTLSSPFASFIWMRRLMDMGEKAPRFRWIGHPAGRDALLFSLGSVLSGPGITLLPELRVSLRGDHTIQWDWNKGKPFIDERTPSGAGERTYMAGLEAVWPARSWLSLSGYVRAVAVLRGDEKNDPQGGMEFGFTVTVILP